MEEQEITYRSLSTLAVLGLVLALVSLAAFLSPALLWPLPWVAAWVAWLAGRRIRKNPETLVGSGLAACGLFLGVAIGVAVWVQSVTATQLHRAAIDRVADRFIELIGQDDLIGAYELTQTFKNRRANPERAAMYYESDEEAAAALQEFSEQEAIELLLEADPADIQIVERMPISSGRYGRLSTGCILTIAHENTPHPITLFMLLERSSPLSKSPLAWRVKEVRFARHNR